MSIKILIGGYQRSGNTFLSRLISYRYDIDMTSEDSYNHHVSSHKKYIETEQTHPYVVPIRNAKDALISHYIHAKKLSDDKDGSSNIDVQILNITELWEFVLKNDKFFIAPFDSFTVDTEDFFVKLENKYPELKTQANQNMSISDVYDDIKNTEIKNMSRDIYLEVGHYPREKSIFYEEAVSELSKEKYRNSLEHLAKIEKKLVSRYA